MRINELARRVATHPNKLLTTLVLEGASAAGYDGRPFFATDHSEGESGAQSNCIEAAATTPTAPTDAEMHEAIVRGMAQMLALRDDQGEPLNEAARQFLVLVPMNMLAPTLVALAGKTLDGTSNPLASGEPYRVSWVANPRLTWTDKFALFRADGPTRPFIFQEELPVQVQVLAEGSELEINENQHQYGVKAIHEAGYGYWQNACLVSFA